GSYVKRVKNANMRSDEDGGDHFYHQLNLAANGHWTQIIWNMHPSHRRGGEGGKEVGKLPHPTDEEDNNYFDALTRFYITTHYSMVTGGHPIDYYLDEMDLYKEPHEENDQQVYSLTANYEPRTNRLVVTWNRDKNENEIKHEVRFAFQDIHKIGWK